MFRITDNIYNIHYTYKQTAKYTKRKRFWLFFQWVLVIPSTILFYFFRTPFALTIIVKWPLFFISTTSLKAIRSAIKKVWENSLVSFSCLDKPRAHCYLTRLNLKKTGSLQFCLSALLEIHRKQ